MTKSRNILAKRKVWSPDELVILKHLYLSTFSATLAKFFGCSLHVIYKQAYQLKLRKSKWYADSPMSQKMRKDRHLGQAYRYSKGHVPANKGIKGISYPGSEKTQFKPGEKPINLKSVGSTRICSKDGYVLMKMAEGTLQWKLIHRIIWERMHGPMPKGYMCTFVDGNKLNISIANLTTISQHKNALRNHINRYGKDIADISRLKGRITRQINKLERGQHAE